MKKASVIFLSLYLIVGFGLMGPVQAVRAQMCGFMAPPGEYAINVLTWPAQLTGAFYVAYYGGRTVNYCGKD